MECIISSRFLFIQFLLEYMKICRNQTEFHLIRQISKVFSTIIDPNFMRIDYDFDIIGDINNIKKIFELWDLAPFYSELNLYKHTTKCSIKIISPYPYDYNINENYIHIIEKKPNIRKYLWGTGIWSVIGRAMYERNQIKLKMMFEKNQIKLKSNIHWGEKYENPIRSIYGINNKKLRYVNNHDLGIQPGQLNNHKYRKHKIDHNRIPSQSKRPITIKYHR